MTERKAERVLLAPGSPLKCLQVLGLSQDGSLERGSESRSLRCMAGIPASAAAGSWSWEPGLGTEPKHSARLNAYPMDWMHFKQSINTVVLYDKLDRRSLNCMQCFKWLHLTFTNEDAIQGRTITKQSSLLNGHHTTEVTPPDACWKTMKTACADTSCCWFVETNTSHTNH